MTFELCMQRVKDDPEADEAQRQRAEAAQEAWRERARMYERQGYSRHNAEVLAAEDVKEGLKREFGEKRHVYLAKITDIRKAQQEAAEAFAKGPKAARWAQTSKVERMDYESRGLMRRFNTKMAAFLKDHHRDILGRVTNKAQMENFVREMHGQSTGDEAAVALAGAVREALEDQRRMFNEAGGVIGQIDNWFPHSHDAHAIRKATFPVWFREIEPKLDWTRIDDPFTGKPMQGDGDPPPMEVRERFMKEVYDNIVFSKEAREATYGRPKGTALYRRNAQHRVLHFKSADDWIGYNRRFGSGDPFKSLMSHAHGMSRDITAMRNFGPNPQLGLEYRQQLFDKMAREAGDEDLAQQIAGNGRHAQRMLRVEMGGAAPENLFQSTMARFLSSARHVMTAAFLDRAIIASISDLNSMRLAAQQVGMNPGNLIARHAELMASSMAREDALRAGWIADTLADPGTAAARFLSEIPPSEVAERLSSASMRIQGLSHWTDQGRIAFQMEMAGLLASQAGKRLKEVDEPLQGFLRKYGINESDWKALTAPEAMYTAANGATFISPMYWRETTDLSPERADEVFDKIQAMIEEQTEFGIPTQSLYGRAAVDPAAWGLTPGTLLYETAKSGLMFKSFAISFSVNQARRIAAQPTAASRAGYVFDLVGGMTFMGAVSLQVGEIIKGNDPMTMTDPEFWGRAAMKGGGFGIIGDIVSTGEASWGGGFGSYVAGPVPQLIDDVWDLTISNGVAAAQGKDPNFAKDLTRFLKRYTPMAQTPALGPAVDRLLFDGIHKFLDNEGLQEIQKAARASENRNGNAAFWQPGSVLPGRTPDLGAVLGQ